MLSLIILEDVLAYDSSFLGTSESEAPECDVCERISAVGARLPSGISSSRYVSLAVKSTAALPPTAEPLAITCS
jgi:hypothetical protein